MHPFFYLLEILELLIPGEPLLLVHAPVNGNGGEILLDEELRQCHTTLNALHEDHHLVELQNVQQFKQLPVFLSILQKINSKYFFFFPVT